ncbi:hypothetical protein V1522DRAFT_460971 [Lipomyces starkeyi]
MSAANANIENCIRCERWAEGHIRNHLNFGLSTASRVEGSHGAMNGALHETSKLCTAISRSALELVYAEAVKKLHQQEEKGSRENCGCSTWNRYLLPCSHRIELGVGASSFLPRQRRISAYRCSNAVALPRKGRPRGTRQPKTSAETVQLASDRIENVRRCGIM